MPLSLGIRFLSNTNSVYGRTCVNMRLMNAFKSVYSVSK